MSSLSPGELGELDSALPLEIRDRGSSDMSTAAEAGVASDDVRPFSIENIKLGLPSRLVPSEKGGRPTDSRWTVTRAIPMQEDTWNVLQNIARDVSTPERRVGASQVGAFLLEKALESFQADQA